MSASSSSASPSPAVPAPKRKHRPGLQRVQIACERCRNRKNKCDGKLPECSACKRARVACIVLDRVTFQQQPRAHVKDLENEVSYLKERIHQLEQDASARQAEAASPQATPLIAASQTASLSEPILIESSSGGHVNGLGRLGFGNVLQASLFRADHEQVEGPVGSNYRLPIGGSFASHSKNAVSDPNAFSLPPPALANRLQDAYFTHRWPALPLLHRSSFLERHYHPVMALGTGANDTSLCLTFMVFALGAIDLQLQETLAPDTHLEFFHLAQNYFLGTMAPECIETVQGLLLMSVFAINEHRSLHCWYCVGQAVRTAIDLGLHRPTASAACDLLTVEMKKRVFWCAYALDRNISISLGRPYAIRDTDIKISLPHSYTDEELSTAVSGSSLVTSRVLHPFDMSTFVHVIKLRQIQSRIQDAFYLADVSNIRIETLLESRRILRAELDCWIAGAPSYSVPIEATFQTPNWFQIAYSHGILLLYRPSPAAPDVGLEGLQICADSAINMISAYSSLYAKKKITYTWIALHSLFMASVTMLYTLWVSPEIRRSTRKTVVKSNVMSCLALFDVMSDYWPLAVRCYEIIDRLGRCSIALFDASDVLDLENISSGESSQAHFGEIDAEYMDWFGTRVSSRFEGTSRHTTLTSISAVPQSTVTLQPNETLTEPLFDQMDLSADSYDWLQYGFDMTIPIMTSVFGNDPYSDTPAITSMQ